MVAEVILNPAGEKYANFLDLETMVKPWLHIPLSDTSQDFILSTITRGISTRMQQFIGSPIAPQVYGPDDGHGKFDGGGGLYSSYIMLPKTPVLKIITLIEYQNQTPVELAEITLPGQGSTQDGYQLNYRTGRVTRILGGIWPRPFMPGSQNVWVTWLAGYNPIPGDILEAALEWVSDKFHAKFQSNSARPMSASEMNEETNPAEPFKGMPYYIENVLQSYIQPSIGS